MSSVNGYRSRDMRGSKVFRRAIDLFGESSIIRTRLFNPLASDAVLEHQLLAPSSLANSVYAKPRTFPKSEKKILSAKSEVASEAEVDEYHKWLERRKGMRAQLEHLDNVEKWLTGKECTPSENKLLQSLQSHNVAISCVSTLEDKTQVNGTSGGDGQSATKGIVKKPMPLTKRPTPQAIHKIEKYIRTHRLRLVDIFTRMDKNKDWLISCSECQQLFRTLQVPITDDEVEELVVALDSNNDGYLDYRELLKGRLAYKLERQQQKKKFEKKCDDISPQMTVQSPRLLSVAGSCSDTDDNVSASNSLTFDDSEMRQQRREKMNKQKQHFRDIPECTRSIRMKQHIAPSTLHKSTAHQVNHYREEELKQFQNLLLYCRTHDIVLNQSILERALLSPGDQDCAGKLKQPRPMLLSSHFADLPVEEEEMTGSLGLVECFGGPYLQLRGPSKGQIVKLTTGVAHIKSKTDCWLTFEEYRKLTQHIKSRFPFKYHGIPDDSVFWPGHILHKMRMCMPPYSEYKDDKVVSVKNIFQPVHSVQASVLPMMCPRVVWPTNEAGYVQSGDNGRKSYAL